MSNKVVDQKSEQNEHITFSSISYWHWQDFQIASDFCLYAINLPILSSLGNSWGYYYYYHYYHYYYYFFIKNSVLKQFFNETQTQIQLPNDVELHNVSGLHWGKKFNNYFSIIQQKNLYKYNKNIIRNYNVACNCKNEST